MRIGRLALRSKREPKLGGRGMDCAVVRGRARPMLSIAAWSYGEAEVCGVTVRRHGRTRLVGLAPARTAERPGPGRAQRPLRRRRVRARLRAQDARRGDGPAWA